MDVSLLQGVCFGKTTWYHLDKYPFGLHYLGKWVLSAPNLNQHFEDSWFTQVTRWLVSMLWFTFYRKTNPKLTHNQHQTVRHKNRSLVKVIWMQIHIHNHLSDHSKESKQIKSQFLQILHSYIYYLNIWNKCDPNLIFCLHWSYNLINIEIFNSLLWLHFH